MACPPLPRLINYHSSLASSSQLYVFPSSCRTFQRLQTSQRSGLAKTYNRALVARLSYSSSKHQKCGNGISNLFFKSTVHQHTEEHKSILPMPYCHKSCNLQLGQINLPYLQAIMKEIVQHSKGHISSSGRLCLLIWPFHIYFLSHN